MPDERETRPSRTSRRDSLSGVQRRVLDHVEAKPGCSIRDIAEEMDRTHQTAQYHLEVLHRKGLIQRERDGRTVRHWRRTTASEETALLRPFLEDDRKRRLLDYLAREQVESVSVNRVARDLDLYHGFVSRHIQKLADLDLVELETHRNRYRLTTQKELPEALSRARSVAGEGTQEG